MAASHCAAVCTLGDIVAEFTVFASALKLWGSHLLTSFVIDYILAWTIGIVFQHFTIAPMRGLSLFPGIWAAINAVTLSMTAWQMGMYAWMALTYFVIYRISSKESRNHGELHHDPVLRLIRVQVRVGK